MEGNGKRVSNLIDRFPDHILLLIFGYLDTLSVVRASRVCCRWYNICSDQSLHKVVDLRLSPLKLMKLYNVSYRKLSSSTTAIHIRGGCYANKTMDKLSIAYLNVLNSKCPNLLTLSLEHFDLRDIPLDVFPPNLQTLSLHESMLSMGWFDLLKCKAFLSNLNTLNLRCCSKISNVDLESLAYLENVSKLNLSNCFRISARGITMITTNLKRLRDIDFSGCPAVNDVVLYYLSNLPLEYLKLRFCHLITDHGINQLFSRGVGTTLKSLDVYSCHEISDKTLDTIAACSQHLRRLDIGACNRLTGEKVNSVKIKLTDCYVLFELTSVECLRKSGDQFCCKMNPNRGY